MPAFNASIFHRILSQKIGAISQTAIFLQTISSNVLLLIQQLLPICFDVILQQQTPLMLSQYNIIVR